MMCHIKYEKAPPCDLKISDVLEKSSTQNKKKKREDKNINENVSCFVYFREKVILFVVI